MVLRLAPLVLCVQLVPLNLYQHPEAQPQKEVECLRALNAYQVPTAISKVPSNVENALLVFNVKVKVSWSQNNALGELIEK